MQCDVSWSREDEILGCFDSQTLESDDEHSQTNQLKHQTMESCQSSTAKQNTGERRMNELFSLTFAMVSMPKAPICREYLSMKDASCESEVRGESDPEELLGESILRFFRLAGSSQSVNLRMVSTFLLSASLVTVSMSLWRQSVPLLERERSFFLEDCDLRSLFTSLLHCSAVLPPLSIVLSLQAAWLQITTPRLPGFASTKLHKNVWK